MTQHLCAFSWGHHLDLYRLWVQIRPFTAVAGGSVLTIQAACSLQHAVRRVMSRTALPAPVPIKIERLSTLQYSLSPKTSVIIRSSGVASLEEGATQGFHMVPQMPTYGHLKGCLFNPHPQCPLPQEHRRPKTCFLRDRNACSWVGRKPSAVSTFL